MKRLLKALILPALCLALLLGACAVGQSGEEGGYVLPDIREPCTPPPGRGDELPPKGSPAPVPSPSPGPADPSQAISITKISFTPTYINTQPIPSGSSYFRFGDAPHILKFEIGVGKEPVVDFLAVFESDLPLVAPLGQTLEFELEEPISLELPQGAPLYACVALEVRYFDPTGTIPMGRASGIRMGIEAQLDEECARFTEVRLDDDLFSFSSCGIVFDLELGWG